MNLRALLSYASGTAAVGILSLLTLPLLAWSFTPEHVGMLTMFQIICSLVAIVFSLGLDQSYVREFNEVNDRHALAKICIVPGLFFLTIASVLILIFQEKLAGYIVNKDIKHFVYLIIVGSFALFFERILSVMLRMFEFTTAYSITKLFPKIFLIGFLFVALFYEDFKNIQLLIYIQVVCWVLTVLMMVLYLWQNLFFSFRKKFEIRALPSLLAFGFPLMLNGIAFWGLTYADRVMLASYSSLAEVGIYSVAVGFAGVALLLQQFFSVIWHPIIYRWTAEGVELGRLKNTSSVVELISFLMIGLVGCFSWILDFLLPQKYSDVQFLIVACMMQPLLIMLSEISGIGISISRKTKALPGITLLSLGVNVALNMLLIPSYGAGGAVAATVVSTVIYLVFKTEFSAYLWVKQPNLRLYVFMLIATLLSISHIFTAEYHKNINVAVWVVFTLIVLSAYKNTFFNFKEVLNGILEK